jgi:DNA helicase HerA-like ATPase
LQRTYSDRLCSSIFHDGMARFIANQEANFIQMYFEEAHNLFPKKNESDLTLIYNRIAKEGAKLNLGLIYATQEVSSISANVLKNTQNWFVSHLNNNDELREVAKYYDFEDFIESLRRTTDKGFIRMKTYSNAFIVPVQIERFSAVKS